MGYNETATARKTETEQRLASTGVRIGLVRSFQLSKSGGLTAFSANTGNPNMIILEKHSQGLGGMKA